MSHGLKFPEPHTILGGAASKGGEVDKINSTHQKIVAYDKLEKTQKVPELIGVNKLLGTGESELRVSAVSPEGHPEGFETRYGAPILGVTSHPEAIHGANSKARENASEDGKTWSDNIFKGFEQSMKAYAGKQEVNAEIRGRGDLMKRYAEYYGGDGTDMPVSWEPYNEEDTVDYGYRDFLRNSPHSPFSK